MREAFADLLEKADLAISSCVGVLPEGDLEPVKGVVEAVRTRLSYPEDVVVAALVGGTGSGKSSLLNAVAGWEAAQVGGRRPTTDHPLALVPERRVGEMEKYLDRLGISSRLPYNHPNICLIDLPDTDSVEVDHRLQVEALLPRIDLVVWVVDPEKYRDAELHRRHLRPMAGHSGRLIFVLNQVDRLAPDQVDRVASDLRAALAEDGMGHATLILTAAQPSAGPPQGVEALGAALENRIRSGVYEKLLDELARGAGRLAELIGGGGMNFEERVSTVIDSASQAIAQGDAEQAVSRLRDFLAVVAEEAGGLARPAILTVAAGVRQNIVAIVDRLDTEVPRRWWQRFGNRRQPVPEQIEESVSDEVRDFLAPVREVLTTRAQAYAALADLAVSVTEERRRWASAD